MLLTWSHRTFAVQNDGYGTGVRAVVSDDDGASFDLTRDVLVLFDFERAPRAAVRALEYQAVARCLRRGQQHEVVVHSFVIADCAEETAWRWAHPGEEEEDEVVVVMVEIMVLNLGVPDLLGPGSRWRIECLQSLR